MVISDESVSGQAPINSDPDPASNYLESIQVPAGEVYYVESVSFDQDNNNNSPPAEVVVGITSAANGFTDVNSEVITNVGRVAEESSPGTGGVVSLGEYAYSGDTIAMAMETGTGSAPHYRVTIRRVV